MTPRARVLQSLRGEGADGIPLTAPPGQVPRGELERRLRNAGLCLVQRGPPLLQAVYHSVEEEHLFSGKAGAVFERVRVRTSGGNLNSVVQHGLERHSSWTTERLFKSGRDYLALMSLFQDQRFESNFGAFDRMQRDVGEDILLRPNLGASPLQYIMHTLMGIDVFAHEWSERPEQVLSLYKTIADNHRRRILQVAKSPALAITYGGPLNAREIGRERFDKYYLPHLREFADVMHTNGKLAGIQVHGDPRLLAESIAATHVDYVEGFHDHGFRLEEARSAWPSVSLWLEVPPAVHLLPEEGIRRWVLALVPRVRVGRVVLSTGSVPAERRPANLSAIHEALEQKESVAAAG